MAKSPFNSMLDLLKWEPLGALSEEDKQSGLPLATHRGIVNIGGYELEVLQLSDGQRIISADSLNKLFAHSDSQSGLNATP